MLELYQTEWCPSSQRVRQRLTELGIDYVARQVPVAKERRHTLRRVAGTDVIPTLVPDNAAPVVGEDAIRAWLDEHAAATAEAEEHSQKAAKARRRQLEEECECLQPLTH